MKVPGVIFETLLQRGSGSAVFWKRVLKGHDFSRAA
jgi:hypothetical protein